MLKESDDLVILGVTSDSKMTFEKDLRSVSRAASQWLGILSKYSMIDYVLEDALGVLSCQFRNTALRCGARLPIHTLSYWTA